MFFTAGEFSWRINDKEEGEKKVFVSVKTLQGTKRILISFTFEILFILGDINAAPPPHITRVLQ